jgi:hypothetical protein
MEEQARREEEKKEKERKELLKKTEEEERKEKDLQELIKKREEERRKQLEQERKDKEENERKENERIQKENERIEREKAEKERAMNAKDEQKPSAEPQPIKQGEQGEPEKEAEKSATLKTKTTGGRARASTLGKIDGAYFTIRAATSRPKKQINLFNEIAIPGGRKGTHFWLGKETDLENDPLRSSPTNSPTKKTKWSLDSLRRRSGSYAPRLDNPLYIDFLFEKS